MVGLTPMKIRRMGAGVRQIDVRRGTGIQASRLSVIENGLAEPTDREQQLIENFLSSVEKNRVREHVEEIVSP